MNYKAHFYCFLNDKGAVFLNRKDEVIKSFDTYNQAISYANLNIDLINQNPIKN